MTALKNIFHYQQFSETFCSNVMPTIAALQTQSAVNQFQLHHQQQQQRRMRTASQQL